MSETVNLIEVSRMLRAMGMQSGLSNHDDPGDYVVLPGYESDVWAYPTPSLPVKGWYLKCGMKCMYDPLSQHETDQGIWTARFGPIPENGNWTEHRIYEWFDIGLF